MIVCAVQFAFLIPLNISLHMHNFVDPFGVDRNVMNAHLQNGLMKQPYRTCVYMKGGSSVENVSYEINTLSCPRILVQFSENMPAFLESILGTLHLPYLKFNDRAEYT